MVAGKGLLVSLFVLAAWGQTSEKVFYFAHLETPQALQSKGVDAIAAWQPNSGNALRQVPGSTTRR